MNGSSHGLPEQYTSDPTILGWLRAAAPRTNPNPTHQNQGYAHVPNNIDPSKGYYMPPPGAYGYYPGMPVPPPPEGAIPYYHQSAQPADDQTGGLHSNLPPADIARLIPCRYYPACRYGPSCMFAHPQGPYYQGPPPPAPQYSAPYDHMNPHSYPPNYYPMPPPPFQPPNGIHSHMSPMSPQTGPQPGPQPPMVRARANSEILSPIQGPFSPAGGPTSAPAPYGAISPISPSYPNPGPPPVPLSIPPLPPLNHPLSGGPQSPQAMYPPPTVGGPPMNSYDPRRDSVGQYPPPQPAQRAVPEPNGMQKSPMHMPDNFGPGGHRDGMTHNRRGSFRRPSFGGSRKPPCLFFPSGRCKNG